MSEKISANREEYSPSETKSPTEYGVSRRTFLSGVAGTAVVAAAGPFVSKALADTEAVPVNLAIVATPSALYVSGDTKLSALNDESNPSSSQNGDIVPFGTWPRTDKQWIQYDWSKPVTIGKIDLYWWDDGRGIGLPASYRVLYWNGNDFLPVSNAKGLGVSGNQFNSTTFDPVTTEKLRLEIVSDGKKSIGILEWKVFSSGKVPSFPPITEAGIDRVVVLGGQTYLAGKAKWLESSRKNRTVWSKAAGPGSVTFANPTAAETTAKFSAPGEYILQLTASDGKDTSISKLEVRAEPAPPKERLNVVYTRRYSIDSPFWNRRARSLITQWIPQCIYYCERTDLKPGNGDGGIDNFIEAAKALRGEPHGKHKGYVFSNAWVHQTVESMCIALMVDAQGDEEILTAQAKMQETLARWIPIILAAQEPDGYLQTAYTLADRSKWTEHWSPAQRGNHEGYVAGYFIESAINHYTLTDGKDLRLYNAAKKLADCWVANIGPGKKAWFDGHQEMEQALVRFGRFVNDMEGSGAGDTYIKLARFLLDSRRGGQEYDQSHLPPIRQYEAVGHAVRAVYFYSGMADIAAETGDIDYQSAVMSLWNNMVNKKYYVTGGVGSGETSEGFGPNYSLPNDAYCESCSSCGLIFFQYKNNLAYHDARFADLYEETMYNALMGAVDLEGKNFCYTNPLENTIRTPWHVCPCCVGNIPRTLLMIPTWSYVKSKDAVYVNLFIGSRVNVGDISGTEVEMVQKTNYPWSGAVAITVNPKKTNTFSVYVRVPNRQTSKLYTSSPEVRGIKSLAVNGKSVTPHIEKGYAVLTREWNAGDTITVEFPMEVQRVKADPLVKADLGTVALRYGPLVYSVEKADQPDISKALGAAPLTAEWREDLLGGQMTITGRWKDGSRMRAVPYYARMNRVKAGPEILGGDNSVNYAPGADGSSASNGSEEAKEPPRSSIRSRVWITDEV